MINTKQLDLTNILKNGLVKVYSDNNNRISIELPVDVF